MQKEKKKWNMPVKELQWYVVLSEKPMAVLLYVITSQCLLLECMVRVQLRLKLNLSLELIKYTIWSGMYILQSF